ncbi:MAG: hypothetical protein E6Q58_04070 [Niabella sp.]|nr:MAG: hypothetical protein E6Q58_04070 [Niabella sp.]
MKNWKKAVEILGVGIVSTFVSVAPVMAATDWAGEAKCLQGKIEFFNKEWSSQGGMYAVPTSLENPTENTVDWSNQKLVKPRSTEHWNDNGETMIAVVWEHPESWSTTFDTFDIDRTGCETTPSPTVTNTSTPSATPSPTVTNTSTPSATPPPTATPTNTPVLVRQFSTNCLVADRIEISNTSTDGSVLLIRQIFEELKPSEDFIDIALRPGEKSTILISGLIDLQVAWSPATGVWTSILRYCPANLPEDPEPSNRLFLPLLTR